MGRRPTDDEALLRDSARDLLAAECPTALLRAHRDDPAVAGPLWDALRDFVPLGLGPLAELCVFTEELGHVAEPTPFFATACLYAPLLDATGEHDLDPVLDGHATGTVALAGADGVWRPNGDRFKTGVLDAPAVDLVAAVDAGGTVTLLAAPPAERTATDDSTRCLYVVDTSGTGIAAGTVAPADLAEVLGRARLALAAETIGTARRLVEATGPDPDLARAVEQARALVTSAADASDAGSPDRSRVAAAARSAAADVAARAADHAAEGPSDPPDPDLGFFVRRARAAGRMLPTEP